MGKLHVGTRKGVFTIEKGSAGWKVARRSFLGVNCSIVMHDPRDGALYAALGHGHFGVKLHRSDDGGATWTEIASPTYPKMPEGMAPEVDAMGRKIPWNLE